LLLCALALLTGCKEEAQPLAPLTLPERPFLTEAEFTQTPTLAARQDQIVVFDLEPTGPGQATAEDVSRQDLEAGTYRYCIETGDPYLQHLSVEGADGRSVVDLDASSGCVEAQLQGGTYRLRLRHAWSDASGTHRLAFLHRLNANATLIGDGGVPRAGWWALAPDDPSGKGRAGRLRALPPPREFEDAGALYPAVEPIIADFSSQQIDDTALFDFSHLGGGGETGPGLVPQIRAGPTPLDVTVLSNDPSSALVANTSGVTVANKFLFQPLQIVDLGQGKVQLQERPILEGYTPFFIDPEGTVRWFGKPPQLSYMNTAVLFRIFFPGDTDYGQAVPGEGEVALYQECNYGGPVAIFAANTPDFSALSSVSVTLDRTTASVKLGSNAAAVLFPDTGYGGTSLTLGQDTPCLDRTPLGRNARSLQIQPLLPIFLATSSCVGCNLSGVDLTRVSVSGADLSQANLTGSTLNRTSLHAARSLAGTDFSGATISCSDLSGTDGGVVDLAQTWLATAIFDPNISTCRTNFSNTRVDDAHLNPTGLTLLNLTNADIVLSVPLPNWDLAGALWTGATVSGGSLQGARFAGASLSGASFLGVNLKQAVLQGLSMGGINLTGSQVDGSQMQDAGLQGAILIDVTGLDTAISTGADFSGAHFGGRGLVGATLEQVKLDGATFEPGSDLSGIRFNESSLMNVDLSSLALYGASFTRANLENSSLAGAFLSNNPDAGISSPADFTGAHLKNVDLSSAQLQSTIFHNASIYGSFNGLNNGPPYFPCVTSPDAGTSVCMSAELTGFTCSCATAVGASMTRTDFSGAFLYGVDFAGHNTTVNGVDFSGAILVGARFKDTQFLVDPSEGGAPPNFSGAFLQGTDFTEVALDHVDFSNAFVDVTSDGNQMQVLLPTSYTGFAGWEAPNMPVCVSLDYTGFVTVPPTTTGNTTCPDGIQHPGGCGKITPRPSVNPNWASPVPIGGATPPGYYVNEATYSSADQSAGCNLNSANFDW